jgi:hypothetical protein
MEFTDIIAVINIIVKKLKNFIMIFPRIIRLCCRYGATRNNHQGIGGREVQKSLRKMTPSAFVRRHLRVWDCFIADGFPTRRGTGYDKKRGIRPTFCHADYDIANATPFRNGLLKDPSPNPFGFGLIMK